MSNQQDKSRELFQQLGDAVNKGDKQSTLAALAKFMQELGLLPDQPQGQPEQSNTDDGQQQDSNSADNHGIDEKEFNAFDCARTAAREIYEEQTQLATNLESKAYRGPQNQQAWNDHLDSVIARQSRKLINDLVSRLSFMKVAKTKYDIGHKAGRITPKCAVRVASNDEKPFAKRIRPGAPAGITLVIAHDVSGSMGHALRDKNQNHSLRLVHALQTLKDVYPSINVLVCPWSGIASCHEDMSPSAITQLDQYGCGTRMHSAFESMYSSDLYKQAVQKGDAIVGVMVTDGETDKEDRDKCRCEMTQNRARSEEWCCVVIDQWNARLNDGQGGYGTAKLEEVFGKNRTFGFYSVPDSISMISKTIQKAITKAESRRK